MDDHVHLQTALIVPRDRVKTIKDALETHHLLDKSIKITPCLRGQSFNIPIKLRVANKLRDKDDHHEALASEILTSIGMGHYVHEVGLSVSQTQASLESSKGETALDTKKSVQSDTAIRGSRNPLDQAIDTWWSFTSALIGVEQKPPAFQKKTSSYTVYPPMLLLPPTALSEYLEDEKLSKLLPRLYGSLCNVFKMTHIAMNAPIPASSETEDLSSSISEVAPNILRSPTKLTPLHGDFGPSLHAGHTPTASDFKSAFWCTTWQNGIFQTWAPRYTMFSRGNISEKARILDLASLSSECDPQGVGTRYKADNSSAVDLYAGIGYFAFSYAKAGVVTVLCWEINPWSVEGMRRGAEGNGWKATIVTKDDNDEEMFRKILIQQPKLIVFQESNENAANRIASLLSFKDLSFGRYIHPIRHVNCGYLPSSKDSWKIAVEVLDKVEGGWIHAHENIGKPNIEARKAEAVDIFKDLASDRRDAVHDSETIAPSVACPRFQQVKSYAPGVIHCVLDIAISGCLQRVCTEVAG